MNSVETTTLSGRDLVDFRSMVRGVLGNTLFETRQLPLDFPWPATVNGKALPTQFIQAGDRWIAPNFDPKTLVNPAIWTVTPYYVDASRSNNTGDGLSEATAKRDINAAITLANADGQDAMRIYVKAGRYDQDKSINGSAGTVEPTKPWALIGYGGRVLHDCGTSETFPTTPDATYTNTFIGGPGSAARVFDLLQTDTHGNYVELPELASVATVNTTPTGGWVVANTTGSNRVHLRRPDGLQPTITNTMILRPSLKTASFFSNTTDGFISGFDFRGGTFGGLRFDAIGTRNLVLLDNTYKYAGSSTNAADGLYCRRTVGLVYIDNWAAGRNWKDGINFHSDDSGGLMYVLALNGVGYNNGKAPSSSNNLFTTHDDVVSLVIGGRGGESYQGSDVHCIEASRTFLKSWHSTTIDTGLADSSSFKVAGSPGAKMWLMDCVADSAIYAVSVETAGSIMFLNNLTTLAGTQFTANGGVIRSF